MWRIGKGWGFRRKNTLQTEPWRKPGKKFKPPDTPLQYEKKTQTMEPGVHWKNGFAKKMLEDHYRRIGGGPRRNQVNLVDHQGTPAPQDLMNEHRREAWEWAAIIDEIEEWETHKEPFAHEAFVSEFICWLLGKSKYNHPNITPWGYQRLHGDTIKQFVLDFVMKKTDYTLELQKLKADPQPPTKIQDAWIYWKYLVSTLDVEEALHGTNYNQNPPVDFSFDEGYLPDMEYWIRSRQDPDYYKSIQRNFWHADQEYPYGATPSGRLRLQMPKEYRKPVMGKSPPGFPMGDRGLNCGETPNDTTVQNGRYYRGAADPIVVPNEEELEEEQREVEEQQEQLHDQEEEEYYDVDEEMEEIPPPPPPSPPKKKDYEIVDVEEEEVPPKHNGPLKTVVMSEERRRKNEETRKRIADRDQKRSQTHPNEDTNDIMEADRLRELRNEDPIYVDYPEEPDKEGEKTDEEIQREEVERLRDEIYEANRIKEQEEREKKEQKRKEEEQRKREEEERKRKEEERKKREEEEEQRKKQVEDLKKVLSQGETEEEKEEREKEQRRKQDEDLKKLLSQRETEEEQEKREKEQRKKQEEDLKKVLSQREEEREEPPPPEKKKKKTLLPLPQESEISQLREKMKNELQPPKNNNKSYKLYTEKQRNIWSEFNKYVREHEVPEQNDPRTKDIDLLDKQRELMELDTTTKGIALDAAMTSMLITDAKYAKGIEKGMVQFSKYTDMELDALLQRMYALKAIGKEYKEAVGPDHDIFPSASDTMFYLRSIKRIPQIEREISKRETNNPHFSKDYVTLNLLMKNKADLTDDDKKSIERNAEDAKLKDDNGMYIAWTKKLQGTLNVKRTINRYIFPNPETPPKTTTTTLDQDKQAVEEQNKKQEQEKLQRQEKKIRHRDEQEREEKRKLEKMEIEKQNEIEAERLQTLEKLRLQEEEEREKKGNEEREREREKKKEGKKEEEERNKEADEAYRKKLYDLLNPNKNQYSSSSSSSSKKQTTTPPPSPSSSSSSSSKKKEYSPPSQQDNPHNMTKKEILNISTNDKYVKNVLGPKKEDLYYVLGLNKDLSPAKIKNGSNKIALLFHPDKFDSELNPETRKVLNEVRQIQTHAAEILNDPIMRAFYDMGHFLGEGDEILKGAATSFSHVKGAVDQVEDRVNEFTKNNPNPTQHQVNILTKNIDEELYQIQAPITTLEGFIRKARMRGYPITDLKLIQEEYMNAIYAFRDSLIKKREEVVGLNKREPTGRKRGWFWG